MHTELAEVAPESGDEAFTWKSDGLGFKSYICHFLGQVVEPPWACKMRVMVVSPQVIVKAR